MSIIRPLTIKQLRLFFQDYRDEFPDWTVKHDVVLVRSQGPLRQYIAFEALRSGAYRPSCSVEPLIAPEGRILFRFLDIKHREVLPRNHSSKWPQIVKAMEEQFIPAIRQPLEVADVLRLEEEDVAKDRIENVVHFNALAALNAYVGNNHRAQFWCDRVKEHLKSRDQPFDWELRQARFTEELQEEINSGRSRAFLDEMLHQRMERS